MANRFQKFQVYRDEDKHECNLNAVRVNALLSSQSLLLVSSAILYSSQTALQKKPVLLTIAVLGLAVSILAYNAIRIGCRVLHKWHDLGMKLIQEDNDAGPGNEELKGCYLDRNQPDKDHIWSVDRFSKGMAVLFCAFWISAFVWLAVTL